MARAGSPRSPIWRRTDERRDWAAAALGRCGGGRSGGARGTRSSAGDASRCALVAPGPGAAAPGGSRGLCALDPGAPSPRRGRRRGGAARRLASGRIRGCRATRDRRSGTGRLGGVESSPQLPPCGRVCAARCGHGGCRLARRRPLAARLPTRRGLLGRRSRRGRAGAADRDRAAEEAKSATAQARFTGLLVVAMPTGGALFAELIQPGFLTKVLAAPAAAVLLALAAALQVAGFIAIRRLARVVE